MKLTRAPDSYWWYPALVVAMLPFVVALLIVLALFWSPLYSCRRILEGAR